MAGRLIDFYLPYSINHKLISPGEQAETILLKAQELINTGYKGVAITYSANYDQTIKINLTYNKGEWCTHTTGANQALVMSEMEMLLEQKYKILQHKVRIAPITTLTYSSFGGKTHEQVVKDDLQNIKTLLDNNWCVLGWINQVSSPAYAIGGGIAQLPEALSTFIQQSLKNIANEYGG